MNFENTNLSIVPLFTINILTANNNISSLNASNTPNIIIPAEEYFCLSVLTVLFEIVSNEKLMQAPALT